MLKLREFSQTVFILDLKRARSLRFFVGYPLLALLGYIFVKYTIGAPKLAGLIIALPILATLFTLYPVSILIASMALSTHTFGLASLSDLPYFQFGTFRFTMMDFLTIYIVFRLLKLTFTYRGQLKLSSLSRAMLMMIGVMFLSATWSLLSFDVPVNDIMHGLRDIHGCLLYFVIIFLIKSRRELRSFWKWTFAIVFIFNLIELFEIARGGRIAWLPFKAWTYFSQRIREYMVFRGYTRVRGFFILPLCLTIGAFFTRKNPVRIWWLIIAMGIVLIPVVFGYTRAYYIFTIVSLSVIILLARGMSRLKLFALVLGIVGFFLVISWFGRIGILPKQDYWAVTRVRATLGIEDIGDRTVGGSWDKRVIYDFPRIVEALKYNPLLGFGMDARGKAAYAGDSGIVSFIVRYGLLGTVALLFMTICLYRGVIMVLKKSDDTFYRIIALGAAGAWAGMLVSSVTLNWFPGSIPAILAGSVEFIRQKIVKDKSLEVMD